MHPDAERAIYGPYHNGEKEVYADPLAVYRRLVSALEGRPNDFLRDARSEDPLKRERAWGRLVPAAVEALALVPFDPLTGKGALEAGVRQALKDFLLYCKKKRPSGLTRPTCSQPTEPPYWALGDYRLEKYQPTPCQSGERRTVPTSPSGSTSDGCGGPGVGK